VRCTAIALLAVATAVAYAANWDSGVRVALALVFVLFVPGLALGELLEIDRPFERLAIATAASLALETIVALVLVYASAYSTGRALAIVIVLTFAALAVVLLRALARRRRGVMMSTRPR
jgi:uncharacterized membrane protein